MLRKAVFAIAAPLIASLAMPALAITQEEAIAAFLALQARVEALEAGPAPVVYRDATGKLIGMTNPRRTDDVLLTVGERVLTINVQSETQFRGVGGLLYLEPSCVGDAFIGTLGSELADFGAELALVVEGVAYAALDPMEVPFEIAVRSQRTTGSCLDFAIPAIALPAQAIIDLDAEFTPPFVIDF